ncbi:MarR family winged helix-turn-helix transcriptional regulator [Streptomyces sp. NBC_00102]|uniref:MarR family winged helix-turn-helix transcriptional regulator n=1 Tax=Streptomyces sp. NBC_00102 TaxID=2975652 RepID=UPI00225BCFEC|nr:MarR family transcriptional regulator [Streptomyces sp. NBC_00102]MCX5397765.1 MarR family transcriptional regulator [Streptomyces sp. NBC_00102]
MPHTTPPRPSDPEPPATPTAPTDLGLVDGLAQLSFAIHAALGKVAAGHDLSIVQLRMFGVLRDREPGMQELARHLGLDKSSATGLVDRAERRGLVRRSPSPHDRRSVQVALTEQGHQLAREATVEAGQHIHALAAHLTDEQRAQLSLLASAALAGPAPS